MNQDPTRRTLLGAGLLTPWLAARVYSFPSLQAGASEQRAPLRLAVRQSMIRDSEDLLAQFTVAREAGFQGVTLDELGTRKLPVDSDQIVAARDASTLAIPAVHDPFGLRFPLSLQDEAIRAELRGGQVRVLDLAARVGAPTLVVVPGVVNRAIAYDSAWRNSISGVQWLAERAGAQGTKIALSVPQPAFLLSPLECLRFCDEVGAENVGFSLDLGCAAAVGWPEQWLRILGGHLLQLELRDFHTRKRDTEGFGRGYQVALGEGDTNWPAVRQALRELAFDGWTIPIADGADRAGLAKIAAGSRRVLEG